VKASDFNKSQPFSTSSLQQIQRQSLTNNKFQQTSTRSGIWFGTRGSGVQIRYRTRSTLCVPKTIGKRIV